ncbi:MAG: aromatic-ring-hydroxylating dioxygenase subunit beta [Pseudomonadota bacterium]|nr:aromatic-ring-hydroxylating dioxygenase subunit beta [Pseudomonadota bacterium]
MTDVAVTTMSDAQAREAEQLLLLEADLLDERRFEEWIELFTPDGYYWVPLHPEQDSYLTHLSIFFDDRELMEARVKRLRHPMIHTQTPPSRTCHYVSGVRVTGTDEAGRIAVSSRILMLEYREGEQRVFGGRARHGLRRVDGKLKIASKRVDLVNCDDVFGPMAIPI